MDLWEEFSDDPTLNTGHFMALTFDALPADDYNLNVAFAGGAIEVDWDMDHTMTAEQRSRILFLDNPAEQTLTLKLTSRVLKAPIVKTFTFDVIALPEPTEPVELSLTTSAASQEASVLNQLVSALQNNDVTVTPTGGPDDKTASVTGTLKYMESFSDFSTDPLLTEGNFLALQISWLPEEADVTIEVDEDGVSYEVLNKTEDDVFVVRVTELTGVIKVTVAYENESAMWEIDTSQLVRTPEPTEPVELSLTTSAASQEASVLNQLVSALQNNDVTVTPTGGPDDKTASVTGTLKYMESFSDFSTDPLLTEGNFLALQISWLPEEADVTIEVDEDGVSYEVLNKTEDDVFVVRVTELTGVIKVTVAYENESAMWEIDTSQLVRTQAP